MKKTKKINLSLEILKVESFITSIDPRKTKLIVSGMRSAATYEVKSDANACCA